MATISTSTLTTGSGSSYRRPAIIAYSDSGASRVTFTILQVESKSAQTRCIRAARERHRSSIGYCPRYMALDQFIHQEHPGRNTVRFPRRLTPAPGSYVLDVTPNLHGNVGRTVVIPFEIEASRRGR